MDHSCPSLTIPRLEAHPLELEVDGIGLVAPRGLRVAEGTEAEREKERGVMKRVTKNRVVMDKPDEELCAQQIALVLSDNKS